jgi:hypothetical protein
MDANKDGVVAPDESKSKGRGTNFFEKGGVDKRGQTQRWLEFKIVYFEINDGVVSTSSDEGYAQLTANVTPQDVDRIREMLKARFNTPPDSLPRRSGRTQQIYLCRPPDNCIQHRTDFTTLLVQVISVLQAQPIAF